MTEQKKIFYEIGDSIEGVEVGFETRQFIPQRPYRETSKLNKLVYPFKMGIQGTIWISQELNPKSSFYCDNSNLNHGDSLRAQTIYAFSTHILPKPKVSPTTSTHKATIGNTKPSFAYARIDIPKREVAGRIK